MKCISETSPPPPTQPPHTAYCLLGHVHEVVRVERLDGDAVVLALVAVHVHPGCRVLNKMLLLSDVQTLFHTE